MLQLQLVKCYVCGEEYMSPEAAHACAKRDRAQ
jgi:hypothetical protein